MRLYLHREPFISTVISGRLPVWASLGDPNPQQSVSGLTGCCCSRVQKKDLFHLLSDTGRETGGKKQAFKTQGEISVL